LYTLNVRYMCENENKILETLNNFLYINLMTYANSYKPFFFNMIKKKKKSIVCGPIIPIIINTYNRYYNIFSNLLNI